MKTKEQLESKLHDSKQQLAQWELEYETSKKDKWLKYVIELRATVKVLRWMLDYH